MLCEQLSSQQTPSQATELGPIELYMKRTLANKTKRRLESLGPKSGNPLPPLHMCPYKPATPSLLEPPNIMFKHKIYTLILENGRFNDKHDIT